MGSHKRLHLPSSPGVLGLGFRAEGLVGLGLGSRGRFRLALQIDDVECRVLGCIENNLL